MTDRRRRYPKETYERMAELREAGLTYPAIATEIGCSVGLVGWVCLQLGAIHPDGFRKANTTPPLSVRSGRTVRGYSPDEDRRLLELEAEGLPYGRIGKQLGRSRNSVHGRLLTLARYDEANAG